MPDHSSEKIDFPDQVREIVLQAMPDGDDLWVPQAPNIWFRPLMFDTVAGGWVNLLRIKRSGVLNRHLHPAPVYGYVLKGSWRYIEHDWVATEGSFVYEPPGEIHTLIVDDDVEEMITLFHVCGALIYFNEDGSQADYEDVHSKIRKAREHFVRVGLGEDFVKQFIR